MRGIITSPLASLVILVLGSQFFQVFITVALDNANHTEFLIGVVHAMGYLGLLISAIHSEAIIRRIGHIRAFTLFSSIMAATILAQSFQVNFYLWVIARFFSGISLAALYVTIESWLLAESSVENRGRRLAVYMIALYISQALSPQLFHLVDTKTLSPYIIAALLCIVSNIPVSLTYKPNPTLPELAKLKIIEVYKVNPYGFIGCFVSGLVLSAFYSFIPKFTKEYNFSIAWMMTSIISGGFLLQWPFGKLSDHFNREKIVALLSIGCIIPAIFILLFPSSNSCYLFAFIIGGLSFSLYPISIAAVCDLIKNRCIVQVTGVLLFSYALGSVFGPLLVSVAIDMLNTSLALFEYLILAMGGYGLFGIYQWNRGHTHIPNEEEAVEFIPLPKQTQLANQLDPRIDLEGHEGDLKEAIIEEEIMNSPIDVEDSIEEQKNETT